MIRNEVEIILKDNTFPGSIVSGKLVYIVVEVEDHGNTDNQYDAEDIRPQKLLDDIPI